MNKTGKSDKQTFEVAASPYNAVKLELVIILIFGFLLWAVLDSITNDDFTQIIVLFLFSLTGTIWLVIRTRYLSQRSRETQQTSER